MSNKQQIELNAEEESQDLEKRWGALLREARIKQGLSVEAIASALYFETKLIEAIEAENLEQLPSASFVRGYLRSYSKLLEVDAEPIVQAYSLVCGADPSVITQVVQVKEVSSKDAGPRYATWLVVAVLAISVVIWWWVEVLLPSAVKDKTTETVIETEFVDSFVPDVISGMKSEESVNAMLETALDTEVVLPEPVPELSTLVLTFTDDSWIEINDAQDTRLYMDMAKAGQTKTVTGEPPFKLLFGNATAVMLEYNGEIYDHSKHNSKGVARFTLGE